MATVEQHIKQWKHNRAFARSLDSKYRDWQINVIFYTALHAVDAAMVTLGLRITNHEERNNYVRTNASFAPIRRQYLDLYRISQVTRYDADPQAWLPSQYLDIGDLVNDLLKPLEANLQPLIGTKFSYSELEMKK